MFENKQISLVFPAYNEEEGIEKAITDFAKYPFFNEIIVVDNNSRDKTATLANEKGARVVKETKQGYGYALRRGIQAAKGDYIVLCEPDGTFNSKDAKRLLTLLHLKKYDMVIGTRTNKKYISKAANMKFFLRYGNIAVAKLMQLLFHTPPITDCGCTFRAMTKEVAKVISTKATVGTSHFLPETVILAVLNKYQLIEIPVNYNSRVGKSKITGSFHKSIQVGLAMIKLIITYRLKK